MRRGLLGFVGVREALTPGPAAGCALRDQNPGDQSVARQSVAIWLLAGGSHGGLWDFLSLEPHPCVCVLVCGVVMWICAVREKPRLPFAVCSLIHVFPGEGMGCAWICAL